ncbi:MAG: serine/threonine protein kinase [Pyrinomonadaceae bacterium]
MKPLAANTLLQNRYLIVHLIGRGGMGDVYLAIDQRLGSAVALKRTFFSGDEMLASAFEREARTLGRLRHHALPKVSDHFTEDDTQYLIMEHIAGDDLAKRLEQRQKPFPLDWVMFWADQLLDALNFLHSQEPPIIHRDIKPQNLKLTDDNSVVLLDFGLSKNTIGEIRSAATTGSVVGFTPHFAPLEQIRGMGTSPRSDVYSLSATLYQLLTNCVPPETLVRAEDLLSGKPDPIKPINEINDQVTKVISDIILKGMEVSQEKRFAGAREMQQALRAVFAQTDDRDAKQIADTNAQNLHQFSANSNSTLKTNIGASQASAENPMPILTAPKSVAAGEIFSEPPKKNSSRTFLTIVGIGAPLILLIAAAIGWFSIRGANSAVSENDQPQTETAISSPTPAPIIESNADTPENIAVSSEENANQSDAGAMNSNQIGGVKIQNSIGKTPRANQPNAAKSAPKSVAPKTKSRSTQKPSSSSKIPQATPLPRILP